VRRRLGEHRRRCRRILAALEEGPSHAYGIAGHLWSPRTVAEQPLLVVWEVLGHLDLLLDEGTVSEEKFDDGSRYGKAWFSLPERTDDSVDGTTGTEDAGTRPARTGAAGATSILYPGVDRSAELE
jgi:hypothetical protein